MRIINTIIKFMMFIIIVAAIICLVTSVKKSDKDSVKRTVIAVENEETSVTTENESVLQESLSGESRQ